MSTFSKNYTTILAKAKQVVPGFAQAYALFLELITIYGIHSRTKNSSKKDFLTLQGLKKLKSTVK